MTHLYVTLDSHDPTRSYAWHAWLDSFIFNARLIRLLLTCVPTHSYVFHDSFIPHQKLRGDGVLTPVPLFCLICTIISNETGIFD